MMNPVSLELGLLWLGEPPYSAAQTAKLLELVGRETVCSAADLTRLEYLAGAMAAGDPAAALDLAARLEAAAGDWGVWLRAALLEACGRPAQAAEALRILREKGAGEERALLMLTSARNLFAAGHAEQVW